MLEKDKVRQSCELEEDAEQLLSQRIDRLTLKGLPVKSLSSLQGTQNEQAITTIQSAQNQTIHLQPKLPSRNIKKSRKQKSTSSLKQTRGCPSPRNAKYDLEDGRMFELTECKGRQAMVSEVRNVKLREFSGHGVLVFPNGKKFEGEWVDGLLIGRAKISHPNGNTYIGDTYNFMKHGKGTLLYDAGQKYVGEFSGGDFHGEGILYNRQGKVVFDGEWRRGKKHQI